MSGSLRARVGMALAAVVVISVAVQAAMLVVEEDEETEFIRGERFDLDSAFHVGGSQLDVVPTDDDEEGTAQDPVEMAEDHPRAHTSLEQDNWMYTAVIEEQTASALATGEYEVQLLVSGGDKENEEMDSVYISQHDANPDEVEGVTVSWDLGPELPENPLFVLKTFLHEDTGETVEIVLESDYDPVDGYIWKGEDGETNPDLEVEPGTTVTFTIRHGCSEQDTAPHNFALEDSDGDTVLVSDQVDNCGDETTETWTAPDSPASFDYLCQFHPDTMEGDLEVTSSGGDGAGGSLLDEVRPPADQRPGEGTL